MNVVARLVAFVLRRGRRMPENESLSELELFVNHPWAFGSVPGPIDGGHGENHAPAERSTLTRTSPGPT